jgi:ATP-dependent DNA helicase RecQ
LKITESGRKVLFGEEPAQLVVIKREEPKKRTSKREEPEWMRRDPLRIAQAKARAEESQSDLFEALRGLRKELADERKVPAYIILSDKVLQMLASIRPTSVEAFGSISGIGVYKKEAYGEKFVKFIRDFESKNR